MSFSRHGFPFPLVFFSVFFLSASSLVKPSLTKQSYLSIHGPGPGIA